MEVGHATSIRMHGHCAMSSVKGGMRHEKKESALMKLRTTALAVALVTAAVSSLATSADAASWGWRARRGWAYTYINGPMYIPDYTYGASPVYIPAYSYEYSPSYAFAPNYGYRFYRPRVYAAYSPYAWYRPLVHVRHRYSARHRY